MMRTRYAFLCLSSRASISPTPTQAILLLLSSFFTVHTTLTSPILQSHLVMLYLLFFPFLFLFGYLFLHFSRLTTTTTAPPKLPSSPSPSSTSPPSSSSDSNDYDTHMTNNTIQEKGMLQMVFSTFDKNGDGYITKQELQESLKSLGLSWEEKHAASLVENLDSNKDGLIDLVEFQALYKELGGLVGEEEEEDVVAVEEELREAFDVFDSNGDGQITVEELSLVMSSLGLGHGVDDCMSMIKKVDTDGDGKVNFQEFKAMMQSARASRVS